MRTRKLKFNTVYDIIRWLRAVEGQTDERHLRDVVVQKAIASYWNVSSIDFFLCGSPPKYHARFVVTDPDTREGYRGYVLFGRLPQKWDFMVETVELERGSIDSLNGSNIFFGEEKGDASRKHFENHGYELHDLKRTEFIEKL